MEEEEKTEGLTEVMFLKMIKLEKFSKNKVSFNRDLLFLSLLTSLGCKAAVS